MKTFLKKKKKEGVKENPLHPLINMHIEVLFHQGDINVSME